MIDKNFIEYLASKSGIENKDLIEKDFILQLLLASFAKGKYFSQNFVFKGGTCLVKCYLGYYRFSEDLDFTYLSQGKFKNKSEKETRKFLSSEIEKLLALVFNMCKENSLDFKEEKNNRRYIEFGGSNKFLTLKIWYASSISGNERFVKIQVNFVELFKHKFRRLEAKSIIKQLDKKELRFLFPKYSDVLIDNPKLIAYDIREILLEKVRAILTRRGTKARDFVDVFLIAKKLKQDIRRYRTDIMDKAKFMLKYEKYRENLEEKANLKSWFKPGEEKNLLLKELKGFHGFIQGFESFLSDLAKELVGNE